MNSHRLQKNDYFEDLDSLALGSRLKRLSDKLMSDSSEIYKSLSLPMEGKWFPLLKLLSQQEPLSIGEAAEKLRLSQPAVSQFVLELKKQELIVSLVDEKDSRRRLIALSPKGKELVKQIRPIWEAIFQSVEEILNEGGTGFMSLLRNIEKSVHRKGLKQRTLERLNNQEVQVTTYTPEKRNYFKTINEEWIEEMFQMEAHDREVLEDPEKLILEPGGEVYFAETAELGVVGTCALLKTETDYYEFSKMGVLSSARGLGIGEKMLEYVLADAQKRFKGKVFLCTNSKCEAAIHLYKKHGFQHDKEFYDKYSQLYDRCDVVLVWKGTA